MAKRPECHHLPRNRRLKSLSTRAFPPEAPFPSQEVPQGIPLQPLWKPRPSLSATRRGSEPTWAPRGPRGPSRDRHGLGKVDVPQQQPPSSGVSPGAAPQSPASPTHQHARGWPESAETVVNGPSRPRRTPCLAAEGGARSMGAGQRGHTSLVTEESRCPRTCLFFCQVSSLRPPEPSPLYQPKEDPERPRPLWVPSRPC